MKKSRCLVVVTLLVSLFFGLTVSAVDVPIKSFPLENYNQNVDHWFNKSTKTFKQALLTKKQKRSRLEDFYNHYFSTGSEQSPWSEGYIQQLITPSEGPTITELEQQSIIFFDNGQKHDSAKIGYGENFSAYQPSWIASISKNINVHQFDSLQYSASQRGIIVDNVSARALPTSDVHFYKFTLPGQGYPFDNLQMSAVWVGTPVYILGHSVDKAWDFVATPNLIGWVPSASVAKADDNFVEHWSSAAKQKMVAITKTKTALVNSSGDFQYYGYVGAVFPYK